jgi:hypothetical protein
MNKDIDEIKKILKRHKEELKDKYAVKEIGVFGSYVHKVSNPDSDLDILVEFNKPIDFFFFLELEEFLSHLTGVKVDLVMKKALKPAIGKHILEEVVYV